MNTIKEIIKDHYDYRKQLFKLAKTEIIKTYKGAALGWSWAIIRPAIQIFVFWFAFSIGLRSGKPVEGYPFFLWLIAGMIPWFYMRDMISGGSACLRRHTHLITKIKFPISTIPTFVSMSFFAVHIGLIIIVILIYMGFGYMPDIYYLQLPFYMALMFIFFTAWGLFAGVLSAMSRDFLNLVKSLTTALFWMSGILYNVNTIKIGWLRKVLLYNPITLIDNGFRNCFVYKKWFWETPQEMMNFVIVYAVMSILALWAYRKLRKDIPDVL
ncbi:ABC transporter permease [Ihubacter sp. rT4E-8]|uniref:ABC transporter permease n=1 Tax=unclassified Ihubacter TaxID=2633299 RepID=UPI001379DAE0